MRLVDMRNLLFFVSVLLVIGCLSFFYFQTERFHNQETLRVDMENKTASSDKIKVIIDHASRPFFERIALEYEQEYGVELEMVSTDYNDLYNEIEKNMESSQPDIDLFLVDTVWTAEFVENNYLEPLNHYIPSDISSAIIPIAYEQRLISNELYQPPELYAFPLTIEGKFLFYNQKILEQAGVYAPPRTWEQLINVITYLKQRELIDHGIVWGWKEAEGLIADYTMLLNAFEGEFKDVQGNWSFNEGGGLKALEFMLDTLNGPGCY